MKYLLISVFLMWFVTPSIAQTNESPYQVGILVMDGVYNTELTAPYDIFQHTVFRKGIRTMEVFLVSEDGGRVKTFEGMTVEVDYSFEDVPNIDILVVPAAEGHLGSDLENDRLLKWVRKASKKAKFVTSHCDGSFLLAASGLPKGTHVTTFPSDQDEMENRFPDLKVHRDVLFVHDGKYITGIGGARSFEAALYLCDHLYGAEITKELARGMAMQWNLNELKYYRNKD